jgi:methylated-DNA-[protein]-cysteine S-methyltransferase
MEGNDAHPERFVYPSIIGDLEAVFEDDSLQSLGLSKGGRDHSCESDFEAWNYLRDQLDLYFSGDMRTFHVDPDMSNISSFRQDVYGTLMRIPYGELITYGDLANMSGHPGACRAVGGAMSSNPFLLIVPCHRVISVSGRGYGIGGFSAGKDVKERLLEHEGSIRLVNGYRR